MSLWTTCWSPRSSSLPGSSHIFYVIRSFRLAWGCEQHDGLSTFQTTPRLVTETFSSPPNSFSTLFLIGIHIWLWIFLRKRDQSLAFIFPRHALWFYSGFECSATSMSIYALLLPLRKICRRYPLIFNIFVMVRSNSQLSTSSGHRNDCYQLFYSHVSHSESLDETTWVCGPSSGHPVLLCVPVIQPSLRVWATRWPEHFPNYT